MDAFFSPSAFVADAPAVVEMYPATPGARSFAQETILKDGTRSVEIRVTPGTSAVELINLIQAYTDNSAFVETVYFEDNVGVILTFASAGDVCSE